MKPTIDPIVTKLLIFRREAGNCQICWSADAVSDVEVSGIQSTPKGVVLVSLSMFFMTYSNQTYLVTFMCHSDLSI